MGPSERKVAAAVPEQYQAAAVLRNLSAAGRDRFSVRRGLPVDGERAGVGGLCGGAGRLCGRQRCVRVRAGVGTGAAACCSL